jgi:hypothetical protein
VLGITKRWIYLKKEATGVNVSLASSHPYTQMCDDDDTVKDIGLNRHR